MWKRKKDWAVVNFNGTGMLKVQTNDTMDVCPDDFAALATAICDGVRIIPIEDLPANFEFRYYGWIDTPENRTAIQAYCRNKENKSRK